MLATLIPMFDDKLTVKAYSLFTQKTNVLLNPSLLGTGMNDGAGSIVGFEVIDSMGLDTISKDKEVFVPVNSISLFSTIDEQCKDNPKDRIVVLMDGSIKSDDMYFNRVKALKEMGFKLAIRKLAVKEFENYRNILSLVDYVLLDNKKIDIKKAKIYFSKIFPNIKLVAVNVDSKELYDSFVEDGGYKFFEGDFYRLPVTAGENEIAPLKVNYIELLNVINEEDYDLTNAASVIGRDTALVLKLLEVVNKLSLNSEITSVKHAAAMLGQVELKKWINTVVTKELCADRPNEITRISLLRAKFAELLAPAFGKASLAPELFLMGLFSVLDVILDVPMKEALKKVKVSKQIENALLNNSGELAEIMSFMNAYESAKWEEINRIMILQNLDAEAVYKAYTGSLEWYRDLFR